MATFKNKTDSPKQLFERYEKAQNRMLLQRTRLESAYDYSLPNRANFRESAPGEQRNIQIFDQTAPNGLIQYGNDVQSILMPPYQRWAKLIAGSEIPENEKKAVNEQLELVTDIFFKQLEQSNFYQVVSEAILDMGISTGIMIFEEGTKDNPFVFRSIPISQVAFEEGRNGKLQNFWRRFQVSLRQAVILWPNMILTDNLRMRLQKVPDEKITLIEGTVLVPGTEEINDEFQYYIQDLDSKKILLEEKRQWNPWIGFRAGKTTGEQIGYGPVLRVLPSIRAVNKMQEWDLRAFKFAALGVFLVENNGVLNPFNTAIEPGAEIPVEPSVSGKDPIRPLQAAGDPKITLEKIQAMQASINQALFSQPLPPETKSGISATEISIRMQEWVRQNSAAFGRLTVELIEPIITIGIPILLKMGIIKLLTAKIDRKIIDIKYESPLIAIQNQQDVQSVTQAVQIIQESQGAEGVLIAYNVIELNQWINEKLGVPAKLVNSPQKMTAILNQRQQQSELQAAAQQQAQLAPGQVQQPQLPLAQQ